MNHSKANDKHYNQKEIKSGIGMNLPVCIQRVVTWKKQSLRIDGTLNIAAVVTSQ